MNPISKKTEIKLDKDYWLTQEPKTKPSHLSFKKRKKVVLTATVTEESYQRLKRLIPEGEVSSFIDQIIRKSVKEIEAKISTEYERFNQDKIIAQKLEKLNICHYEKKPKH